MIPVLLEILSCFIAAIFASIGLYFGLSHYVNIYSYFLVAVSGLLMSLIVIYLSQLGELMQGKKQPGRLIFCQILNKFIYGTIISLVIIATLTVK